MQPIDFDPFAPAILSDPYPWYAKLRESAPVYHVPNTDIWAVSRYADADAVLRNHAVFSSTGGVGPEWDPHPMLSMYDPPEHTRLRRLVAGKFTPKFVVGFKDRMETTTERVLDALLDAGKADLVSEFAQPLAVAMIADLLGIPTERREDFRRWSIGVVATLSSRHDPDAAAKAKKTSAEFVDYIRSVLEERRRGVVREKSHADIIGLLLEAGGDEVLTAREITAFCVLLLVAGFETTVNGLTNTMNALMTFPKAWQALRQDPTLVESMIEESLRYDSPDQTFFRNTLREVTLRDVVIPAQQKVMVLLGSGNRDGAKYPAPDLFDVRRNPVDHLAFGSGIHYCLGAALARQQFAVTGRALVRRARSIESSDAPVRHVNVIMRGFRTLPAQLTPA